MKNLPPNALDVVSFVAGGHCFAVEAKQVRAQLPEAISDGAISVEEILGLPYANSQNPLLRRVLLMTCRAGNYAVTVAGPVELRVLEINAIYPLPPLIAASCRLAGIRALAMGSDKLMILVEFQTVNIPVR